MPTLAPDTAVGVGAAGAILEVPDGPLAIASALLPSCCRPQETGTVNTRLHPSSCACKARPRGTVPEHRGMRRPKAPMSTWRERVQSAHVPAGAVEAELIDHTVQVTAWPRPQRGVRSQSASSGPTPPNLERSGGAGGRAQRVDTRTAAVIPAPGRAPRRPRFGVSLERAVFVAFGLPISVKWMTTHSGETIDGHRTAVARWRTGPPSLW